MPRHPATLVLISLLGSAPLLSTSLAVAAPEARSLTTPSEATRVDRALGSASTLSASPRGDLTPITPIPMNLPDDATADEIEGQYGFGIASLALGAALCIALMLGSMYFVACRSWSTSH